jgi:hypothetical protein
LLAQHPELVGGVVTALAKTKQGAEGNLAGKESELRAELARVARAKKTIVNRLLECGETPLGEAIKERFNQADQRETALRMQLDELHESHGAAVSVKPTRDSIEEALAAFEKTVEDLPAAKVKQIIRMLVNDIKVTRIDHTHTPQFAHLAASSMVLKFDLTLSPTGIHYSNSPALAERWSASEKKSHERKAKFAVTFEIRRCGRQGNQVHLLEPISAAAKIIEFSQGTSARQGPPTSSTPLSRLDEIQGYLAKGMKKKEVAEKFGKTAAWVSYHLRLSSLSDKIVKALCGAPASVSAAFGLVRLMSIAAIKGKVQQEATFDLEYRRASNSGSGRRRGAGSLMRISSEKRLALLAQFQSSGMSMAAFAEQQGIKYPTFAGWIASDKRRAAANATATQG